MALVRFDPFRELEEVSTRLGTMFGRRGAGGALDNLGDWAPPVDVEETETEFLVKTDLPDMPREQIKVALEDGVLTIEGERRQEKQEKKPHYHRLEREYGKFVRRLMMPSDIDETKVTADLKNGVLSVRLPKSSAARPRTVAVKVE